MVYVPLWPVWCPDASAVRFFARPRSLVHVRGIRLLLSFYLPLCVRFWSPHQARFVPTLVLERLRAVGEAAAVPKKQSTSGSFDAEAAEVVDVDEGANLPKVRSVANADRSVPFVVLLYAEYVIYIRKFTKSITSNANDFMLR